ncbi:hypothetical protein CMI37_23690 [Candidatus Pacearchaeota archaeon]|nr:hypothetical protein [Candidatus Pacearchaeota archaeon]|tara:strand:- start:2689 stop:3252 length:564 start_codon:yes stop_codon:yes gene_type:complete
MAVTEKQLKANRENAKKGGVKTLEGKALVRLNALKHGLLSCEVLLARESAETLAELEVKLIAELRPQGELEIILVDRIVSNIWRLKRALMVERQTMEWEYTQAIAGNPDPFADLLPSLPQESEEQTERRAYRNMIASDYTEKIMRYEAAIERQIYKAVHELIRLQMARGGAKPPAPAAIDIDTPHEG